MELLLSAGANPNRRGGRRAECPLLLAARKGHGAVVRALLFKGAHAAAVDDRGWTALHCAAFSGHTAVALALLTSSPQPALLEARTSRGETPLALAAFARREDTVRLLLARGAQPSCIDDPRDMAFAEEMAVSLRYTNSRTERTCEKGSKSPSRVGSFGLSSIIGMLRPGGSGNGRTVFALPQPDGGRRWTEASGSGSRSGAERCAASQPVTARGSSGARAGRPGTAPPQPLGRSASGQGGGSGSPSAPLARGSPSGEAPKQQPPAQRQQVSPRANSNARRRPASAVPSATPRYMAALGSKARAREAKTSAPVHTHPAWAPDPRSAAPRAPAPSAITPAPETAPAAPEPEDVWRLHELSYRGMPLLHHRRTNLLYTSVPDDSYPHVVGVMANGAPRWLDPGERQAPGQGRDEGRDLAQRQGHGPAAGVPPLAALAAQAQAMAALAATCPAAAVMRRVGVADEVVVRLVVGLGVHQVSELRALAQLDPEGPSWAPGRLGLGAGQRAELLELMRRHLLGGEEGGGQGVEEQCDDGWATAGPLDPSLSGLHLTQHVLERYGLAKLMVQVVEQQLREPSSLTCLWDLRGLSPWEEARLGALLRDLPALLEAQRGAAVGEGGAAAGLREDGQDGGGEEQEADGVDQDPEVVAGLGNKVFSNLYTVTSEPVSP